MLAHLKTNPAWSIGTLVLSGGDDDKWNLGRCLSHLKPAASLVLIRHLTPAQDLVTQQLVVEILLRWLSLMIDEDTNSPSDGGNGASSMIFAYRQFCKCCHLVAKFSTKASGATWWPNLQPMLMAPSGGWICLWRCLHPLLSGNSIEIHWKNLPPGCNVNR